MKLDSRKKFPNFVYKSFIVQVHRKYIVIHKKKLFENLFVIVIYIFTMRIKT